jgi:hypothetical protein
VTSRRESDRVVGGLEGLRPSKYSFFSGPPGAAMPPLAARRKCSLGEASLPEPHQQQLAGKRTDKPYMAY